MLLDKVTVANNKRKKQVERKLTNPKDMLSDIYFLIRKELYIEVFFKEVLADIWEVANASAGYLP